MTAEGRLLPSARPQLNARSDCQRAFDDWRLPPAPIVNTSKIEVVVDHERRVVAEALLEVDVFGLRMRGRWPAWRGGSRAASPRSWPRPGRGCSTRCTARGAGSACGTRRPGRCSSSRLRHPGALLGQEAAVLLVALPVLEVDLLVRDVDVATRMNSRSAASRLQVRRHQREEAELGRLPLLAAGAAREVAADDAELAARACRSAPRRSGLRRRTPCRRCPARRRSAPCASTGRHRSSPSCRR